MTFYSPLYTNENLDYDLIKDYVHSQNIPFLNSNDKNSCEGLLTIAKCKHAIFSMQTNKATGCDGIPVEFYQVFWVDLNHILVDPLNECYANKAMSNTQRKAFDVIDMLFVNNCIEKLNFGPSFRKWVEVLYTDISSSVIVNGMDIGYVPSQERDSLYMFNLPNES